MAAEAECYHVLPASVPSGWVATRASLEALMRAATADELYRTKGVVPLAFLLRNAKVQLGPVAGIFKAPRGSSLALNASRSCSCV